MSVRHHIVACVCPRRWHATAAQPAIISVLNAANDTFEVVAEPRAIAGALLLNMLRVGGPGGSGSLGHRFTEICSNIRML